MVHSPVRKEGLGTTEPNTIPIENLSILVSKQRWGEIGKGDIERKKE